VAKTLAVEPREQLSDHVGSTSYDGGFCLHNPVPHERLTCVVQRKAWPFCERAANSRDDAAFRGVGGPAALQQLGELAKPRGLVAAKPERIAGPTGSYQRPQIGALRGPGREQDGVEQQFDADVGNRACRPLGQPRRAQPLAGVACQLDERRGLVKCLVAQMVEADPPRKLGARRVRGPEPQHPEEVGQHRAEDEEGRGVVPGCDRRVANEVHPGEHGRPPRERYSLGVSSDNSALSLIDVDPISEQSPSAAAVLLRLRAREPAALRWQPGQHLELFVGEGAPGIPYSIASAEDPERPGEFELAVSNEGNADWLARARAGQRLRVSAARGEFVWRPRAEGSLFVGMGTGLSPLRAMLQAAQRSPTRSRCTLLFGARTVEDILWRAEFEHWASDATRFRFVPTLSQAASAWTGRRGRVQAHLEEIARELSGFSAYVCGNRGMVSDCVRGLTSELGFDSKLVFSEAH